MGGMEANQDHGKRISARNTNSPHDDTAYNARLISCAKELTHMVACTSKYVNRLGDGST